MNLVFMLFARARRWLSYFLLKQAMRHYGCTAPLLVDAEGRVVDGNRRVLIARELGIDSLPVLYLNATVEYVSPDDLEIGCSLDFERTWSMKRFDLSSNLQ